MIRVCMICKTVMGEKEPLENKSLSHGLCFSCMPQWLVDTGDVTEAEAVSETLRMKEKHLNRRIK